MNERTDAEAIGIGKQRARSLKKKLLILQELYDKYITGAWKRYIQQEEIVLGKCIHLVDTADIKEVDEQDIWELLGKNLPTSFNVVCLTLCL